MIWCLTVDKSEGLVVEVVLPGPGCHQLEDVRELERVLLGHELDRAGGGGGGGIFLTKASVASHHTIFRGYL